MIFGQNRENKNSVSPLLYSEKWITFSTTFAFACGLLNHTSSIATGYLIICGFDPGVISRYPLLFTEHAGKAMDYTDVDNLFRKLRKKTGIYITPHMFRHTSLSLLNRRAGIPNFSVYGPGIKIYTPRSTPMSILRMKRYRRPFRRHRKVSGYRERGMRSNGSVGGGAV